MRRHAGPTLIGRTQPVLGDQGVLGIEHAQGVVQTPPDGHGGAAVARRHRIAIAVHADVAVPGHLPHVAVAGVEGRDRQGPQRRRLARVALGDDLPDRAVHAPVSLLAQPGLGLGIEMRQAVKRPIAHEKVRLDITNHALVLALGAGPIGPAGPRGEAVVTGQVDKARVKAHVLTHPMLEHGRLLIVDQHLVGHAGEPGKAAHQRFVGVLGVLAGRRPEVKAPRIAQRIDRETHLLRHTGDLGDHLAPVVLQLLARRGLETHCRP